MAQGHTLCDGCIAAKRKTGGVLTRRGGLVMLGGLLVFVRALAGNIIPLLYIGSWIIAIGFILWLVGLVKKD